MSTTWAVESDLAVTTTATPAQVEEALEFASFVLYRLSGMLYAPVQLVTESYDTRVSLCAGSQIYPVFIGGQPYNINGCSDCACDTCGVFHRTRLRGYPVRGIYDVWADGVRLNRTEYAVLDNAVLGLTTMRFCNVRCLVVRYAYGTGVPPGGKAAVAKLASQLLLSAQGADCDLPARVTSVTRQGLSWTLLDPQDFLKEGRTGIYEIDMLLHALNPAGALARPRVFSPDLARASVILADAPPVNELIGPNDQIVTPGDPATWTTQDPALLAALAQPIATLTRVAGMALADAWHYIDLYTVAIELTAAETAQISFGDVYTVVDANGKLLLTGRVYTLR